MLLRINNVRIPLVSEASLREASARRLGVKKQQAWRKKTGYWQHKGTAAGR